jgi:hypothetical protein
VLKLSFAWLDKFVELLDKFLFGGLLVEHIEGLNTPLDHCSQEDSEDQQLLIELKTKIQSVIKSHKKYTILPG